MTNISFTVLMCTYKNDNCHFLERAIKSVFNNSIQPDHFILTIDGPIPIINFDLINRLSSIYPIEINQIPKNIGLALALNNALDKVTTEWVARADSDDFNLKDRFLLQTQYAQKNFDVIGGFVREIDSRNEITDLIKKVPLNDKDIKKYMKFRNPINHMTAFYKTKYVRAVGGYPNIYLREDYGLWIKLAKEGAIFHNIDNILVNAEGGNDLFRRRSGIKSAYAEYELQSIFFASGLKTLQKALIDFFIRAFFLSLPFPIIKNIYKFTLRNPLKKSNQKL